MSKALAVVAACTWGLFLLALVSWLGGDALALTGVVGAGLGSVFATFMAFLLRGL